MSTTKKFRFPSNHTPMETSNQVPSEDPVSITAATNTPPASTAPVNLSVAAAKASEPASPNSDQGRCDEAADKVYRDLLKQYVGIYDKGSWSLTLGALAVGSYIVGNLDKIKGIAGTGNTFVTLIAIAVIAVMGLFLKAIHNRLSNVLMFQVPEVTTEAGLKALRQFERCFMLDGDRLIERFAPERAAAARRKEGARNVHERWSTWLGLVTICTHISFIRNLAILVTICGFALGTVSAINGHDQALAEIKIEMNHRMERMREATNTLEKQYKDTTDLYNKSMAAMGEVVHSTKAELEGSQKMVESQRVIIEIQEGRIQNLTDGLTQLLTWNKKALEKDGSPASITAARALNEAIEALGPSIHRDSQNGNAKSTVKP